MKQALFGGFLWRNKGKKKKKKKASHVSKIRWKDSPSEILMWTLTLRLWWLRKWETNRGTDRLTMIQRRSSETDPWAAQAIDGVWRAVEVALQVSVGGKDHSMNCAGQPIIQVEEKWNQLLTSHHKKLMMKSECTCERQILNLWKKT